MSTFFILTNRSTNTVNEDSCPLSQGYKKLYMEFSGTIIYTVVPLSRCVQGVFTNDLVRQMDYRG